MIFSFVRPQYLFLLFLIPLFFIIHFFSLGNKKTIALRFANFEAISRIQGIDFFSKNIVNLFLNITIIFLLILAVGGMRVNVIKESSDFSFVLAIDSSYSMVADDVSPNRITASKLTAIDFVDSAPLGVKIGVVSFSGSSVIKSVLTQDKTALKSAIKNINAEEIGGTDIFEAVVTSSDLLREDNAKAIILLSDGQINVGDIEEILYYANKNKVLVHTIGIGTKEGGSIGYAMSKMDEDTLKSLAYSTGGIYFSAQDSGDLAEAFSEILKLTTKDVSIDLENYLILIVIVLITLEFFLSNTKYLNIL